MPTDCKTTHVHVSLVSLCSLHAPLACMCQIMNLKYLCYISIIFRLNILASLFRSVMTTVEGVRRKS